MLSAALGEPLARSAGVIDAHGVFSAEPEVLAGESEFVEDLSADTPMALVRAESGLDVIDSWTQRWPFDTDVKKDPVAGCNPESTAWDLTPDVSLKAHPLARTGCVIGLEANPAVVKATQHLAANATGGLTGMRIIHGVLAPGAVGSERKYWVHKRDSRLSSFSKKFTCSGEAKCKETVVKEMPCSDLFYRFGTPAYIHMGAGAAGCFEELVARKARGDDLPRFVSAKTPSALHPALKLHKLGYTKFKLVRRETRAPTVKAWGDDAVDCGKGADWQDFSSFQGVAESLKENAADAACPWKSDNSVVYDVHAARD